MFWEISVLIPCVHKDSLCDLGKAILLQSYLLVCERGVITLSGECYEK